MPSRHVVAEPGPSLETSRAVLAPELSLSVDNVEVGMEAGTTQNLLVTSFHRTEKPILNGIKMFQFVMLLQHRVEIVCPEATDSTR